MQFWALIIDSFRESLDRKIFWVMLLITLVVAATMACIGFEPGRIDILFGAWVVETDLFTIAGKLRENYIASIMVEWITDLILGSIGVFLAIIATGGFFPAMLDRGAVEVLISKPIPRWKLLLGKFVGGAAFIFVQASIFVLLVFLVAGVRWQVWLPRLFVAIPLLVLLFSYLYCVSALVGVLTRSTITTVLVTIFGWVVFAGIQSTGDYFEMYPEWKENQLAYESIRITRWIIPKTQDITLLARRWTKAADPTDLVHAPDEKAKDMVSRAKRAELVRLSIPPAYIIGTSLLFEAAVVMLAMWKFSRQDY